MIAPILLNWVVLAKKDSCDIDPRLFCVDIGPQPWTPWIGEAMKPFLAYVSDLLDKCQTYLSVTAQRSRPEVRYRQDILIISAIMLVVLVLFLIGAYVITRF